MKIFYCCCLLLCSANVLAVPFSGGHAIYTYPKDKAIAVHPKTNIGFTFSEAIDKNSLLSDSISVFGGENTRYWGTLKLADNRRTVIFIPSEQFHLGSVLSVRLGALRTLDGKLTAPVSLSFTIRKKIAIPDTAWHSDDPLLEKELHKESLTSVFPESIPAMNILVDNQPQEGNIYIGYLFGAILDQHGAIISSLTDASSTYIDLKPHSNGTYSFYDSPKYIITDTNFLNLDTVAATEPYNPDEHEICRTAEGDYLIIGNDYVNVDMRQYVSGGDSDAFIVDPAILKYDIHGNLLWEWRAIDHFMVADATFEDLLGRTIDFCHINAIEFDSDSNLLLSCRNMDEITKINRTTGDIIWRLGGKHNDFQLAGDTMWFSHQHAIRRTDAGTYIMMDNGNFHKSATQFSRAIEYRIDTQQMIATRLWEFRHSPDIFSMNMGYVQRLDHKSTLICWGDGAIPQQPGKNICITEVDSNNTTRFEMGLASGTFSYRAYKYTSDYLRQNSEDVDKEITSVSPIQLICSPNPVLQKTIITCSLAQDGYVSLSLYDPFGREISKVYQGYASAGSLPLVLDAQNFVSGMYYLRCISGAYSAETKIIIAK